MKTKLSAKLSVMALALLGASYAEAATHNVAVFGDRYDISTISSFYDGLADTDANIISSLDSANLTGKQLLWAVQPASSYTATELSALSGYLSNGGRIAFMGEHGTYAPTENNNINLAINSLGGNIKIENTLEDAGFRDANRTGAGSGGKILSHPLTNGVNTYNYAAFAPLTLSGNAEALMVGDNENKVMMAYQNIGSGSIFLITDQNVWDNVNAPANDNKIMFQNLISASVVTPPVPEPETYAMLTTGLLGLYARCRRNRKVTKAA